jgi:hypothetical protein
MLRRRRAREGREDPRDDLRLLDAGDDPERATARWHVSISMRSASRLKSSSTLNVRKRRPFHRASAMKSIDQIAFGLAGTCSGALMRDGSRRLPRRFKFSFSCR